MSGRAPLRFLTQDVDLSWHERAACRGPDVPAEWFSAVDPPRDRTSLWVRLPRIQRALQVCARCPVTDLCLRQALADPHAQGVWGGRYVNRG